MRRAVVANVSQATRGVSGFLVDASKEAATLIKVSVQKQFRRWNKSLFFFEMIAASVLRIVRVRTLSAYYINLQPIRTIGRNYCPAGNG